MRQPDPAPRKVVIGSLMYAMYGGSNPYPGLDARLGELSDFVDAMAGLAAERYADGLDLVVLPEVAVNGGLDGPAAEISIPFDGAVREGMARVARSHATNVVVPLFLTEADGRMYSNACVVLDRAGDVVGTYRKVFPVAARERTDLEGGVTPGVEFPVFDCDFGRLGVQVCYDIAFDAGWQALADAGAEIVAWPTQSPQTVQPAIYANRHRYYLVSSTWRNNATLFHPNGMVAAQIREPQHLLVHRVDLSWRIVGWQPKLGNGALFERAYGDRAGFDYSEAEDEGIFWSNDPDKPIGEMVAELDLESNEDARERNRRLQDAARPAPLPV